MSAVDISRAQAVQERLVARAVRDLRRLFRALDLSDGVKAREALVEIMTDLVTLYGEAVATEALNLFLAMRQDAGVKGAFVPVLASGPDVDQIEGSVRWAVSTLFGDKYDAPATLGKLEAITTRLILNQARQTVADNVVRRGSGAHGWARVLGPGENCDFCLMLSSRGFAYRSFDSASAAFHDGCHCMVIPGFEGQTIDGYDPDEVYKQYKESV